MGANVGALFDSVARSLLDAVGPSVVLSVASATDPDAERLAAWCATNGVHLERADRGVVGRPSVLPSASSSAAGAEPVDAALVAVGGDRAAVADVLRGLRERARAADRPFPLVMVQDVEALADQAGVDRGDDIVAALLGDPDHGLSTLLLPPRGGLLLAADPQVADAMGTTWADLRVPAVVWRAWSASEREPRHDVGAPRGGHRGAAAPVAHDDLGVARRVIERQDRQLAALRAAGRREDALERQVQRLERELDRLRGRRSVRVVLRVAEYLRPLFRLWRGDISLRDVLGRPPRRRRAPVEGRQLRTHHEFASTDTGRFYDLVRPLVETGPVEFVDRWAVSEEQVRAQAGWPAGQEAPLVSIVMPTHDRAHLIGEAIDTVTDQAYVNWELLVCDDASQDDTESVVRGIDDDRIRYLRLPRGGAAAARNAGLAQARGELIAYLDTDNLWHPRFLDILVRALVAHPGRHMVYGKYIDVVVTPTGAEVKKYPELPFDYERLMERNFVDLNSLVHRRALYDRFGGFNEDLVRQQDWDLILKYAFLRDPLYVDRFLAAYRRNAAWGQITDVHAGNTSTQPIIESTVAAYFRDGLPTRPGSQSTQRLSVLSWDICRNHFSKAYNVAEAVAADDPDRAQLVGFRFFDEPIFPPYAEATPHFATVFLDGAVFPAFDDALARAVAAIRGDVVYAVKPRLPSLGMGLLANYHFGYPLVLETNDLESVVTSPAAGQQARAIDLAEVDPADPRLRDPHGALWTEIMEGLAPRVPLRATHNHVLDDHFGGGAFYVRNPKDETWFDPDRYDRDQVRAELGFGPDDRVLLFGGMVRRHKGVFQFAELLERLGPQWHLLVVGSRETPDQQRLRDRVGDRVRIIEPVDRNAMARVNLAGDAVVLWLDPDVAASHYQMPYKLTDALAMRVPVLANPIGELADLGRDGYLRLVPFGDDAALAAALAEVVDDSLATDRMVDAGRRLYLRQFSYRAVRATVDLLLDAARPHAGPLPVAEDFARFFARFRAAQPHGRDLPGGVTT